MKKKRLDLERKLSLNKDTIMQMANQVQYHIRGGEKDTRLQCAPNGTSEANTLCLIDIPSVRYCPPKPVSGLGNVSMCNPTEMTKQLCEQTKEQCSVSVLP